MSSLQQNWKKRAEQVLPGSKGPGAGGRNDSSNVCKYEYMNKEKKYSETHRTYK
jgi:hypothetical protein